MKLLPTFVLLLLSSFFFCHKANAEEGNFSLLKNKKSVVIPFKFSNKNIIIPLTINNSDSLYFMLDTGLTHTLITELFPEDSLLLNNTGEELIKGLGGEQTLEVVISYDNEIRLKGIKGTHQRINLIKEDIFNLSRLAGHKINGIIGYDFLKHFIVKIDYVRQQLTLYNPKRYKKKLRNYLHFPLEIRAGKPYIRTDIIAPDKQRKNLKLMIDTGASLSLWLMDSETTQIPKPPKTIPAYLGQGLSGKIYGEYGYIPSLFFKHKELQQVLTAYPTLEDVKGAIFEGRNGSIGSEILRRFHVLIDYPNQRMALKANNKFNEKFDFNSSGIDFYQPNLKLPLYSIFAVREHSPAAKAGLQVGDILLKIDGKSTLRMRLGKLITILRNLENKRNKTIKLELRRNDSLLNIQYKISSQTPF